jgi:hypothetical protein
MLRFMGRCCLGKVDLSAGGILHSQPLAAAYIHKDKQDPRELVLMLHAKLCQ